jgi:hypothetical protein
VLAQRNTKLEEAQKAQADLIRKQRALDDAKRELDLTVEKRVQASLAEIRQKRKAEQGSQQLQGEALELELETTLQVNFPTDGIEAVGKGEFGGVWPDGSALWRNSLGNEKNEKLE